MLLELAISDAYGRPFEFNTPEFIKENNDLSSYKHRIDEEITGVGIYTDDTQMSIAISELMLSKLPGTQIRFATHFVSSYKRDERKGYSKRMTAAFNGTPAHLPFEFILKGNQAGSKTNGCVMRAVPLGLLPDPKEIIYKSIVQTSVTHGSLDAVNSATFVSLTAHFFYYLYDMNSDLETNEYNYSNWMKSMIGEAIFNDIYYHSYLIPEWPPLLCDAKSTAAVSCKLAWGVFGGIDWEVYEKNTASSILKKAVSIGGDVDSSAAISMGLYSLRPDAVMDLPQALYDNLENGKYGRDYLISLDKQLFEMYPRLPKTI